MARKSSTEVAELLHRAQFDAKPGGRPSTSAPKAVGSERRYIYGSDPQATTPGYAMRPVNRKAAPRKRRSTFNVIGFMFLSATGIILYIGNLLTVNELAVEVHRLQTRYDKKAIVNNDLKAEINRKSAWERIGNAAKQQVGLIYPKERPQTVDVDKRKLEKFRER